MGLHLRRGFTVTPTHHRYHERLLPRQRGSQRLQGPRRHIRPLCQGRRRIRSITPKSRSQGERFRELRPYFLGSVFLPFGRIFISTIQLTALVLLHYGFNPRISPRRISYNIPMYVLYNLLQLLPCIRLVTASTAYIPLR